MPDRRNAKRLWFIAGVTITIAGFVWTALVTSPASAQLAPAATQPTTSLSLTIDGLLVKPTTLDAAAIAALPHVSMEVTDHKTGNKVTYRGVPLRTILTDAGAPLGNHRMRGPLLAHYVVAECADGYKVVFALSEFDAEFAERSIIIADESDGRPLAAHEGPLRIVVPQEAMQARWARMVTAIHVKKD